MQYSLDQNKNAFSLDAAYEWELPVVSDNEKGLTAMVLLENLPNHIASQYEAFLTALSIPFDESFCVGKVVFNGEGELVYFGFPSIGIEDGIPQLKIGDKGGDQTEVTYIPLTYDGGDYKIMGHRLNFNRVKDNDGKTIRVYFEMDVKGGDSFLITPRTPKDSDFDTIKMSFDLGSLETVLSSFTGVYGKATTLLKPSFENDEFPKGGVLLELGSCRLTETEYEGSNIESVNFRIVKTSHPDLIVQNSAKEPGQYTLKEVGYISFSKSTSPFSLYQNGLIDESSTIWVHFSAPATDSKGNPKLTWTPKHTATKVLSRIPAKALAAMMTDPKATLEGSKEAKVLSPSASVPTVATPKSEKSAEVKEKSAEAKPAKSGKTSEVKELKDVPF